MQGGEHQVTGQRRLDGDFRRFQVTNFTDHDDVRVLAQEGAHRHREGQPAFAIHRDLIDAGQLVLHRVLDGEDIFIDRVDAVQNGVQRGRFSRTGWAGGQHHAVGFGDELFEFGRHFRQKPETPQPDQHAALIEDAHDAFFAEDGGQDIHAHIVIAFFMAQVNAAVLRDAPFGDIHIGHNLQAGDQRAHGQISAAS